MISLSAICDRTKYRSTGVSFFLVFKRWYTNYYTFFWFDLDLNSLKNHFVARLVSNIAYTLNVYDVTFITMGISAFCGYLEKCLIRGHNIFMQWKWNNYRYSQVYQAYATNTMMNTRNGTLLQILVLIITFKACSSHRDNNFLSTIVAGR